MFYCLMTLTNENIKNKLNKLKISYYEKVIILNARYNYFNISNIN